MERPRKGGERQLFPEDTACNSPHPKQHPPTKAPRNSTPKMATNPGSTLPIEDQFVTRLSICTPHESSPSPESKMPFPPASIVIQKVADESEQCNFMHDQQTGRVSYSASPVPLSPTPAPSPSVLHAKSPVEHRRKSSLMPPVTEEDLRNDSRMGHRDPESVAALFGADFASRFCLPAASPALSVFQLRKGLSPDQALLPHEIRDSSVPSGTPIVKMRRRTGTQPLAGLDLSGVSPATMDSVVPLSPVSPKFPSMPCCLFPSSSSDSSQLSLLSHARLTTSPSAPPALDLLPGVVRPPPVPFPVQLEPSGERGRSTRLVPFKRPEPGQFYQGD